MLAVAGQPSAGSAHSSSARPTTRASWSRSWKTPHRIAIQAWSGTSAGANLPAGAAVGIPATGRAAGLRSRFSPTQGERAIPSRRSKVAAAHRPLGRPALAGVASRAGDSFRALPCWTRYGRSPGLGALAFAKDGNLRRGRETLLPGSAIKGRTDRDRSLEATRREIRCVAREVHVSSNGEPGPGRYGVSKRRRDRAKNGYERISMTRRVLRLHGGPFQPKRSMLKDWS